jgi:hypothetical protein
MRQAMVGDRVWCGLLAAAGVALLAAGCEPDLGECDMTMLGGSDTAPHTGQALVNGKCASGRCHSVDAKGDLREGAPADLNFDIVPTDTSPAAISKVRDGAEVVHDNREDMWGEIDEGSMPPGPPAGSGALSDTEKETIRNWLACGGEVIAVPPTGGPPVGADWTAIYEELVSSTSGTLCASCHNAAGAMIAGNGFLLGNPGDSCAAYNRVVNAAAKTTQGMCAGKGSLVVPNSPDTSILLRKVEGGTQICGVPMPQGTMGLGATRPVVMALRAWIVAGAMKPMGCP